MGASDLDFVTLLRDIERAAGEPVSVELRAVGRYVIAADLRTLDGGKPTLNGSFVTSVASLEMSRFSVLRDGVVNAAAMIRTERAEGLKCKR